MKSLIRNVNGLLEDEIPLTGIHRPIGSGDRLVTLTNREGTNNTTENKPKSSNPISVMNRSNLVNTRLDGVFSNRTTTKTFRFNEAKSKQPLPPFCTFPLELIPSGIQKNNPLLSYGLLA